MRELRIQYRRLALLASWLALFSTAAADEVTVVDRPQSNARNGFYTGHRLPLRPAPFLKLPVGAVEPRGWLRKQLELQADGYVGHLPTLSRFLQKDNNAWIDPQNQEAPGWEEVPYWLRGYISLAYLLQREDMISEARSWIDAALASQAEDGYFGPTRNRKAPLRFFGEVGKPDLWANMVMTDCLISYYEHSGDQRIVDMLVRYFDWISKIPDGDFLVPYWQQQRGADLLTQILWLYDRTGEPWLLDLAHRTFRNTANWLEGVPDHHNVNMAMAFRGPATYWLLSNDPKHLQATYSAYEAFMRTWGQVPGGGFAGDERVREGYTGARQMFETCGIVEMMHSHELLTRFTGDPVWADRCEDVTFNSLPAATTADHRALRYLTAPNMVLSDSFSRKPAIFNGGPMTLMNPHGHRCCQHNSGFGWPYFAENLWYATPDNGLAAVLYCESAVTAKVGDGTEVTIAQATNYPFDEAIEFSVEAPDAVRFPLYLRVPGWCERPRVRINGADVEFNARPNAYIRIDRRWQDGDRVRLEFPMPVRVKTWEAQQNAVSIHRGPLAFSIKIEEKHVEHDGTEYAQKHVPQEVAKRWPIWEIEPASAWNYGLVLKDSSDPNREIEVSENAWPRDDQPFAADKSPIELRVKAQRIPNWRLDDLRMPGELQPSPACSGEPVETIALVPMGAARLRIAAIPTVGEKPNCHEWEPPAEGISQQVRTDLGPATAGASHCFERDTLAALNDGIDPKSSVTPRFTWWPRKGSTEWVEYRFDRPQQANASRVFWFDDRPRGGCRTPKSWRLLYRTESGEWKPVEGVEEYPVTRGEFDAILFEPVTTDGFRIEVDLQEGFSSGILEWQVFQAMPPTSREKRKTSQKAGDTSRNGRPNILILLADDMGYSDIGCFGSEIETPNIDRLAAGGLRFTQFYNAGRCCPSRASLLTGLYPHQADIGHMAGDFGVAGYRDRLSPNAVTVAEVLKSAGYRTLMTGKWHLGWRDDGSPTARGFDRFYGTRGYVDSYFSVVPQTDIYLDDRLLIPPTGTPINHLNPEQEWYTTDVFTDYALHFLDESLQGDQPFFLYLAYNAPHFPLHARPEDLAKYRGKYRTGWEKLRETRYKRLVELGIIEDQWQLSPQDSPDWDSLPEEHKDEADLKMALYAGIVDRLDQNIGRVIRKLEQTDQLDNTLVLFLADNGGCAETGMWGIRGHDANPGNYDQWARKGGWASSYGQAWANVSNVPFRMYKRYSHEGGIATPLIVHWPARINDKGALRPQPGHLIDIMATCIEVAKATYPTELDGRPTKPLEGKSLVPDFENRRVEREALYWEHEGNRAIRVDEWKLVSLRGEPWELYNLRTDRSEVHDLSSKHPDKVAELKVAWENWARRSHVLPWSDVQELRRQRRSK